MLFDIDGTLLSSGGAGKRAVAEALRDVFGETGRLEGYSFAGRTDAQIVHELLGAAGWARDEIEARLPAVWAAYLAGLQRELRAAPARALPGVHTLLDRLADAGDGAVVTGLLTGNLADGARLKLTSAGLDPARFRVGAFGSDHADRPELPAVAVQRAHEATGLRFDGREVVVIGDTPFDIRCGDALGVRTVAVATGPFSAAELASHRPDFVFPDLSDTDAVARAILDE